MKSLSAVFATCLMPVLGATVPKSPSPGPGPGLETATRPGRFSVTQVPNPNHERNGALAYYKALRKYGAPIPEGLQSTVNKILSKRSRGSAAALPEKSDLEFLTPVDIGTPPQSFNLDIDSGSGDLWVFGSGLPDYQVNGQNLYNPNKSSTARKVVGGTWEIQYGDGSYSAGLVYTDVVSIGGISFGQQAVEYARVVSDEFTADANSDGLVGLAFSEINTVKPDTQKTFFDNIMQSLDKPVWTADLKAGAQGSYNFGYIDDKAHRGSIVYTDVDTSKGFWEFNATGYSVASGGFNSTNIDGIADTGTTIVLLPTEIVTKYYGQVTGAAYKTREGGWVFPCSAKLPDFSFQIGDRFTVPGQYINYSPTSDSSNECFGGIQEDTGIGFSIIGDVALKAWFVVFDGGSKRLGFAHKNLN